jgi:two-component system, chemotaxis family, CheB/CheR fusion protein
MGSDNQSDAVKNEQENNSHRDAPLSVVGIGSSAGGLEALTQFFKAMPMKSGLAFVLVSHLDPRHNSMLPELLQNQTKMKVRQVADNMQVFANQVYVIPPDKDLAILNNTLQLLDRKKTDGPHRPIDVFFRSLARDQGTRAVGIVLSGTGTDGTLGIKAIKAESGLIIVQDSDSAKFDGMPANARATGLVDHILPPEKMPEYLLQYVRYHNKRFMEKSCVQDDRADRALHKIFILIRTVTGHDFSLYKKNTVFRRIERRMYVHQIYTIDEYVDYLRESEREVSILFKELLIGVTSFFRDPEAFLLLKEKYLFNLLQSKPDGYPFRIWVPGCSSGEEVYSIAIVVQECIEALGRNLRVQLFGTDLDEEAISVARAGIYLNSISIDVDPKRLEKFFVKINDHYQIKKSIREMVVFAEQNVIKDPPFTKLDMLCCRNLLIYFGSTLQEKLLPIFHYSLKPGGILLLGTSENIGRFANHFTLLDKKWKIFERCSDLGGIKRPLEFPQLKPLDRLPDENLGVTAKVSSDAGTVKLLKAILSQSKVPVCVVVDDKAEMIYAHGRTGRFLEPAEGEASSNILKMARPGLKAGLTNAIHKMSSERTEVVIKNLRVKSEGISQDINLIVRPLPQIQSGLRGLMLIIFDEIAGKKGKKVSQSSIETKTAKNLDLKRLEDELETSNEGLKSTNEELQSTNEELETSKEELQSLNEESSTVNSELQTRIDELVSANDDIKNLLDATDIATIFLDNDLNIRRFTPLIGKFFHLTPSDVGRSIEHFASTLKDVDIREYAGKVLKTLEKYESVIEDGEGEKYRMRVRPFRTMGNMIEGVVVTFLNVTEFNNTVAALDQSEASWRELVKHSPIGILVITEQLFSYINPTGLGIFGATSDAQLFGTPIAERLAEESREQFFQRLKIMRSQGTPVPVIEKKYIRVDGTPILCETYSAPIVYKSKQSTVIYLRIKEQEASLCVDDQ